MSVKHECKTIDGIRTWYFLGYDQKNVLDAPYRAVETLRRMFYGSQHVEGTPGDLAKGQTKQGDKFEFVSLCLWSQHPRGSFAKIILLYFCQFLGQTK
jgi:hypothetical protein